jgi:gluconolactonase
MAVDSAGNVCQATLMNGGVTVVSPDGKLADFIPLPDPFVTNICFGGEDLRSAYITLAGTGRLIKMEWPRPGLVLNYVNN